MDVSFSPSSSKISALVSPHRNNFVCNYQTKLLINPTGNKPSCAVSRYPQNLPSFLGLTNRNEMCSKVSPIGPHLGASLNSTKLGAAESEPLGRVGDFAGAFWRFLRPHTIRGTILASIALATRTGIENPDLLNWSLPLKAFFGLVTLLCANGYIVGINQIFDVEIDKVNKPDLPIAAGDFSVKFAWLLVTTFALTGAAIIGMLKASPYVALLYFLSLFQGTIYSVPPFRMKRYPVVAFLIIASVRGFLLNYSVYYATRATLGLPFQWSLPVAFMTTFGTVFALVIALTKDLPDVEGDRKYRIPTLATNVGVRNIAFLGSGILLLNYAGAIAAAVLRPQVFRGSFMIPAHAVLALCLIFQVWVLDQNKYTKEACTKFYRFIWKLFYSEFIVFPFI